MPNENFITQDPIALFNTLLGQAANAGAFRPEAFVLSTADANGCPHGRFLLLKSAHEHGFTFFTNYEGRKGKELQQNPRAALVFYWPILEIQVRISGTVEKVSAEESDHYFRTRPRASQISTWASRQDEILENRNELDARFDQQTQEYEGKEIPRPPYWGGYRCLPDVIEFWEERPHRLHNRVEYVRNDAGEWKFHFLSP